MTSVKVFPIFVFLFSLSASAQEYSYSSLQQGGLSYSRYLSQQGIAKVSLGRTCNNNVCRSVVFNQDGKKLKIFSKEDSVSRIADGRYFQHAYLLVSNNYKCGDKRCIQNLLINEEGKIQNIRSFPRDDKPLASRIGKNKTIYVLGESSLVVQQPGQQVYSLKTPEKIISGHIGFNSNGLISIIAVARSGQIYCGDARKWKRLKVKLAAHGDRIGVASIYPENKNQQYIVLYRYTNEYNKGLYGLRYDSQSGAEEGGWLFNSEERNIGFDPSIYRQQNGTFVISAKNSSVEKNVHFVLTDEDFFKLNAKMPEHVLKAGNGEEKFISFMLGAGVSQLSWIATSNVKNNDITLLDVDYTISDSLYKSINFEGRIGDTNLSLQYLKNKSKDVIDEQIDGISNSNQQTLGDDISSYFFSTFDFKGLISPATSMRIQAEFGSVKGLAKVSKTDEPPVGVYFSTDLKRIAVLAVRERGLFIGGDYISYTMPSAVGYIDASQSVVYDNIDSGLGFQALRMVVGYDALAYSKRYETDYRRFYLSGSGNVGFGYANVSSQIEQDALSVTSADKIDKLPVYMTFGFDMEAGYLWQQRFKNIRGLGYSFALGYRASYSIFGIEQSKDAKPENGALFLVFEREDFMHGPFLKANIIF